MHIYLIGYRGSGKTTVGKHLAVLLGCPIVDTDDVIESSAGVTIREIFETEGESGFRDREQQVVADVAGSRKSTVIALGGGAVLREANQAAIRGSGRVVWLQGSPASLFDRIQSDNTTGLRRPKLSHGGGYEEVVDMLAAREPVYRQIAQKIITTDLRTPDEIAAEIAAWVISHAT